MLSTILIILLVSAGGTLEAFVPPDGTPTQFTDSFEGTKQFLSWARTRIPKGSEAKICIVEAGELKRPTNLHAYLMKERQAAADALGTDFSVTHGPHKLMQQAVKLYGVTAVDYQLAQRVCG